MHVNWMINSILKIGFFILFSICTFINYFYLKSYHLIFSLTSEFLMNMKNMVEYCP
jgi:hypothetical protein